MENQLFDNVHRTKNVETATGMKEVGEKASAVKLKPLSPGFPLPFDPDKYKAKTDKVAGGKRYIPLSAMEALGKIFLEGVPKYGEWNWKNGAGDKPYQMERWEHASRHLQLWAEGDRSEDHLAKVMWFCATQIELERLEKEGERVGAVDLDELFHFNRTPAQLKREQEKYNYCGMDAEVMKKAYEKQGADELFSSTVRQMEYSEPGMVEREGVVDTLKEVGLEVGTGALLASISKLLEIYRKKKEKPQVATVWRLEDAPKIKEVKKEKEQPRKKRVMSEEGKARIAAAQRKRWAKVRREKKAQAKYDPRGVEVMVKGKNG